MNYNWKEDDITLIRVSGDDDEAECSCDNCVVRRAIVPQVVSLMCNPHHMLDAHPQVVLLTIKMAMIEALRHVVGNSRNDDPDSMDVVESFLRDVHRALRINDIATSDPFREPDKRDDDEKGVIETMFSRMTN